MPAPPAAPSSTTASSCSASEAILDYLDALQGGPAWDDLRDRERIDLVWVRPDRGLARRLADDPAWQVVHRDDVSVLFRREPPQAPDRKHLPVARLSQADRP